MHALAEHLAEIAADDPGFAVTVRDLAVGAEPAEYRNVFIGDVGGSMVQVGHLQGNVVITQSQPHPAPESESR